jgi:exodeoxyribonuclease VII small subunit
MAKAAAPLDAEHSAEPPAATFEAALRELETIVQSMEAGTAPLEESLAAYARGIALLRQCQETLSAAEQRVRILEQGVLSDIDSTAVAEGDR